MTRLIYPSPVELDGKLMVSTEIQTHYRCPHCDVFSSASDLLPDERTVYCHSCGGKVELPKTKQMALMGEAVIRPEFSIDWTDYVEDNHNDRP